MNGKNGTTAALVLGALILMSGLAHAGSSLQQVTTIDSSQPPLITGNGDSGCPILSPDGRYVLFASSAKSLVTISNHPVAPTFPALNVFLRDRTNGTTTLISLNTAGTGGGNADSWPVNISTNGRYVVFESYASDLVKNETNNSSDIFIRDLENGTTTLVSVNTDGGQGNGNSRDADMTPDGRYIAFVSAASNLVPNDTNGIPDVFVRDVQSGTTTWVSVGAVTGSSTDISSEEPNITSDGRYVSFRSNANLLTNVWNINEIYVRDLVTGTTTWASVDAKAQLLAAKLGYGVSHSHTITADGRFIFYKASSTSYGSQVLLLRYSSETGTTDLISTNVCYQQGRDNSKTLDLTPDGRFVCFISTNGNAINVVDTQTWTTTGASSVVSNGASSYVLCHSPVIDESGRYVAFLASSNLWSNPHVYLFDSLSNTTEIVEGDKTVFPFEISKLSTNGPTIAFTCADGLVNGDRNRNSDIFVRDMRTNVLELVSVCDPALPNSSPNGISQISSLPLSADGRFVAFSSYADNLVPNDTNGLCDIFVHDFLTGTNVLVSAATNGSSADGMSFSPIISPDGRYVAFSSGATNLLANPRTNFPNILVRDLQSGTTTLGATNLGLSTPLSISSGGQYLLFSASSYTIYVSDVFQQKTYTLSSIGKGYSAVMTPNGRFIAYLDYTNLFVWDNQAAKKVYTNTTPSISQFAISPDGNQIIMSTVSSVYAISRTPRAQSLVATNLRSASSFQFSPDGQFVVFKANYPTTSQTNMQIFLYSFQSGQLQLVSQNSNGQAGNSKSDFPSIGLGDRFIAYRSWATNLLPGVTNGVANVFLYDRQTGATSLLSTGESNEPAFSGPCISGPLFSADGKTLVFGSMASELFRGNVDGSLQLFAYTLLNPEISSDKGQGLALDWLMAPGKTAQVQYKESLSEPWKNLPGNVVVQGNRASFRDSGVSQNQKFYRIVVQ